MISRCEADYGRGNCEMSGLIAYPKWKCGYSPFGCCICHPTPPNCRAIGTNGGIDLSCAKKIILGDPIRMSCASGKQYDAYLCSPCQDKFDGIGLFCWSTPPASWVDCGSGSAKDDNECATVVTDQILSVGMRALTIASLGTTSLVKKAKIQLSTRSLQRNEKS
jgi:hypothetical protein